MNSDVSTEQLQALAERLGMHPASAELEGLRGLVSGLLDTVGIVDTLETFDPRPGTPLREHWPAADDPLGAWARCCTLAGAPSGPLRGRSVAVKDNVLLAGVPLANGSAVLDGYVPEADATIVTRLLEAGATITGKSVCEAYCFSGASHTAVSGVVRNPHDHARSAGGSSSGSAALVAAGEVDMAIGCDQGGSIRMPASFCGIVGMKATFGLVPYTGILGMNPEVDHVGPMTATVADNALLLEVLAGEDGLDSRQAAPEVVPYVEDLDAGVGGLRIAVVREGFAMAGAEDDVNAVVRAAAERFATLGARVEEISVREHAMGAALATGMLQATIAHMFDHDGVLLERADPVLESCVTRQHGWRRQVDSLPPGIRAALLAHALLCERYGYRYVVRAARELRRLRARYDAALAEADLLLMPTTPMKAPLLPAPDAGLLASAQATFAPLPNTQPFNYTHHPALSLPCGMADGLPVGMMLVGAHHDEAVLYRAAHAFERHADWRTLGAH